MFSPRRYNKKPMAPLIKQENLAQAFKFMKEVEKIHLVNIGQLKDEALK